MEVETREAPPVVAVIVVYEPGPWFEEVLDAYGGQDYPNLRVLFLQTGADETVRAETEGRIRMRLPHAFVRSLDSNPGFGVAANEVLRLVDGENGFFLVAHDDVAPEPDMVRLLVEELVRSNAGVVGPKLVDWDDPSILRSVGLGVDRFGEVDQPIEPGEVDQQQHDGVRDVFVLPSACLLARADLFRQLDGFDPGVDFHGEDVELCWRVHHSGARVVVVPSARARHRGGLVDRRPDLPHLSMAARHRVRTVATLTGAARLPGRLLELVLLTLGELIAGVFTGRLRQALASARALFGSIPRIPSIVRRRRAIRSCRQVPEREVLGLQERGSARLSSYLRTRQTTTFVGADRSVRRWRESTTGPVIAWLVVLGAVVLGSRAFIQSGVPPVGQFLPFPDSPGDAWSSYLTQWWAPGPGTSAPDPTGYGLLPILSVLTLFRMALLQTVFVVGLVIIGLLGVWKTATVFPSTRARIGALVVYAASPLVVGAFAIGSLDTLVAYAAVPWMVHAGRRAVGVDTADPRTIELDLTDGIVQLPLAERLRRTFQLGLVIALAAAFTPVLLPMSIVVGLLVGLGTLLALASVRTALLQFAVTLIGAAIAALLHLPWIGSWTWDGLVGATPIGDPGRGLLSIASFEIGPVDLVALSLAFYVPLVAALLLARAWRLTWSVRAGMLVVGFGALAVLGDGDDLPIRMPHVGVLLVPVAFGLAIAGAAALAAFDLDVRGGSFGWRQPLGLLAGLAVAIGAVPGAVSIADGSWNTPSTPLVGLVQSQLPDVPEDTDADYRVLMIGDARMLPGFATHYRDGISYSIVTQEDLTIADRWERPTSEYDDAVVAALDLVAEGSTQRAGRLLAPLAIRFIVIPEFDGVVSTVDEPLPSPVGLTAAFDEQLDIVSRFAIPTVEFYENASWLPTASVLTGATAEASESAGADAIVRADLGERVPAFVGVTSDDAVTEEIPAGTVHLAVPFDGGWSLTVDGREIEPRRAFGTTMAFDVAEGGVATLSYSSSRGLVVAVQVALWLLVMIGAGRMSVSIARRRRHAIADETLLSFDDPVVAPAIDPGLAEGAAPDADADVEDEPAAEGESSVPDDDPTEVPTAVADAGGSAPSTTASTVPPANDGTAEDEVSP